MNALQLQAMEQAGGLPGLTSMAPFGNPGGASMLMASAGGYASPIAGNSYPDTSPLAPLNLMQYGMPGILAAIFGGAFMSNLLEKHGIMSTGNAGSYLQAERALRHRQLESQVRSAVANQDAESFYRTMRGTAALLGLPFNHEQREAARSLAGTISGLSPTLSMLYPGLMDALTGESGSVQAMAAQMMEANRYRIDPYTGRFGYSTEADTDMVSQLFEALFAEDQIAKMQGFRAGEVGEMYRQFSPRGLIAPQGSLRDRTLRALISARNEGELAAIGEEAGVDINRNLATLTSEEMQKLRGTSSLKQRMTEADVEETTRGIHEYARTLKAIREIFGENGNPDAPIPSLIGALESLTSGRMHQFSADRLQRVVRDLQAMTQLSGKSVDQLLAMSQQATSQGQELGLGGTFAPTAVGVGVTTGMAFQTAGGVTGFGAISREEAEYAAQSLFNRGQASELANTVFALRRIEQAGGFTPREGDLDTPEEIAGERLRRIMEALRNEETTYIDPVTGRRRPVPAKEGEFRSLVAQGGVPGLSVVDFNAYLSDFTANKRAGSEDPALQRGIYEQQRAEAERKMRYYAGRRLADSSVLERAGLAPDKREQVAAEMGRAGISTLMNLLRTNPQAVQDESKRNQAIAEALLVVAKNNGIELTDEEALNLAPGVFGVAENQARKFGHESFTAWGQSQGPGISEVRRTRQLQVDARSRVNEALSNLGPQGGMMQRLFTAIQKQGDRGEDADLVALLTDMFGVEMESAREQLVPEMQQIAKDRDEIRELVAELENADPERRAEISRKIEEKAKRLENRVLAVRETGLAEFGIGGGAERFNREDVHRAESAARNLEHFGRSDRIRLLSREGEISDIEVEAAKESQVTVEDLMALAEHRRNQTLVEIDNLSARDMRQAIKARDNKDIEAEKYVPEEAMEVYERVLEKTGGNEKSAMEAARRYMRDTLGSVGDFARAESDLLELELQGLSPEDKRVILKRRRERMRIIPTEKEIEERRDLLTEQAGAEGEELTDVRKAELTRQAEEQLIAENQLRVIGQLGEGESLTASAEEIREFQQMDPELRRRLSEADAADRTRIVTEYIDRRLLEQFYRKSEEEIERRRRASADWLETQEGRQVAGETAENLETVFDLRREFLLDEDAASRVGPAEAAAAVEQSRMSQHELQTIADRYYGGDLGRMIASGGVAMTDKGVQQLKADYKGLMQDPSRQAEREQIAEILTAAGQKTTADELTEYDYRAYQSLRSQQSYQSVLEANDVLAGAADNTALAESLGVTEEQLELLKGLEAADDADISEDAEALGISEEEYLKIMTGEELPKGMTLFRGDNAAAELRAAQQDADRLQGLERRIEENKAELARSGPDRGLQEELAVMEGQAAQIRRRDRERMKAAGFDPDSEQDRQRYQRLLRKQGEVEKLEKRREAYLQKRETLKSLGLSDEQIDKHLADLESREAEAESQLARQREIELQPADLQLAEAAGLDISEDSEELQKFRESLQGNSGDARTQARVAEILQEVDQLIVGVDDGTALEKLDAITDEYAAASAKERKEMAKRYGMSDRELERMMRHTEFLDLESADIAEMTEEEQREYLLRQHASVKGRDIVAQVEEEESREITLRGTLEVTGVVQGEGTVVDATGQYVR